MTARQFSRELMYPLTEPALLVTTLVFTLLLALAGAAGFFGLWLGILVVIALVKFLLDVLRARARGERPETPGIDAFNPASEPWKLVPVLLLIAFVGLALLAARNVGPVAGIACAGFGIAAFPLLASAVAIEQSGVAAFNVRLLSGLLGRIGTDYLWVPLGLAIGLGVARLALSLFGASLLVSFINNLTLVLAFSLTGAVLYHARDALGLDVRRAPEVAAARLAAAAARDRQSYVDRAYAGFSRGNVAAGIAELKALLAVEDDSSECHDWLFVTLGGWRDKTARQLFAARYLERLLRDGRDGEALIAAGECVGAQPSLVLSNSLRTALTELAVRHGNVRLAEQLAQGEVRAD